MRFISRLDIKNDLLIKSISFDGVKKIGNPEIFSNKYYKNGIDEIMLINNTGSLYGTKLNPELVKKIRSNKNCPISAGGGIDCLNDAISLNNSGADKIVLNSLIHKNEIESKKIIDYLGGSSVIGAIQTKKIGDEFKTFYEMSREYSGKNLNQTIEKYIEIGVGEILITSIEDDGCYSGLNKGITKICEDYVKDYPILISGGLINEMCLSELNKDISGIVISSSLHYEKFDYKNFLKIKKKYD
tara:strand:+ start:1340 stop:2068 length:729 start_codon:yes stop_codon:yes gene_type:complete